VKATAAQLELPAEAAHVQAVRARRVLSAVESLHMRHVESVTIPWTDTHRLKIRLVPIKAKAAP